MKNSDELRDELNDSPFLKKMKEQPGEGFNVPKHYFQQLPDEVMRQMKQPAPAIVPSGLGWLERIEQFVLGLMQPRYALALASVLVLVAAVVFLKEKNAVNNLSALAELQLEDISDEELFAYVSNNISDFDRSLVVEASAPEVPESVQPKKPTFKAEVAKPDVEEMEEYLDEVIDEVDLKDLEEYL